MYKSAITFALALGLGCGITFAQENEEARQRAERMREEARQVEERAREQSERLREESRRLMEQAGRSRNPANERVRDGRGGGDEAWRDLEMQIARLNSEMTALKARQQVLAREAEQGTGSEEQRKESNRQMQQATAQMRKLQAQRQAMLATRKQPAPMKPGSAGGDDRARRLKHMRVAAENLRAAGMDDVAQAVMSKADGFEREMRGSREGAQRPPQGPGGDRGEVEALRRELQQLREEVRRMRATGPQGGGPGRGDRVERPDRPERPERPEREVRPERPERPEQPQPERPQ